MRASQATAGLVVVACAVAAAGCGGGDNASTSTSTNTNTNTSTTPDPVQRFARGADAVCLQASAAFAATTDPDRQIEIVDGEVGRLQALQPPAQVRAAYREFVDLRARRNAERKAVKQAIAADDNAAYYRHRREYLSLLPQAYAAAGQARLSDCAGKLPVADSRAIVTLLRREEAHPQASDCRTALTERFVRDKFQDVAACERELPRGASASVTVATPRGTLPLAVARVSETGGNAPTRSQDFTMLKAAGQWRIDSIRPVQTGGLTP
jgi:hypothetical protein